MVEKWKQWWNYLAFQHGGIFVLGTRYRVKTVLQSGWGKVRVGVVVEVCARGIARFLGGVALGQFGYYGPLLTLTNHQCQFRPLHVTWYYCSMWRKKLTLPDPVHIWDYMVSQCRGATIPWAVELLLPPGKTLPKKYEMVSYNEIRALPPCHLKQ